MPVKAMFADIHRQAELTEVEFERLMYQHKKAIMKTVRRFVPEHKKAAALAKRFAEHGESYFLFVEDTAIAPTNNVAEQNIRTFLYLLNSHGNRYDGDKHHDGRQPGCWINEQNFDRMARNSFRYGNWYVNVGEMG